MRETPAWIIAQNLPGGGTSDLLIRMIIIAPDMYEKMVAKILETDADICSIGILMLDEQGKEIKTISPDFQMIEQDEILVAYAEHLRNSCISCYLWDKLYKFDLWKCVRFPDIGTTQDRAVMPYVLAAAKKLYVYQVLDAIIFQNGQAMHRQHFILVDLDMWKPAREIALFLQIKGYIGKVNRFYIMQ